MNTSTDVAAPYPVATEDFLDAFFAHGNDANLYPQATSTFKKAALAGDGTPIVLPRFVAATQEATMYVIANDPALAPHVPDLINAFAGPTYCKNTELIPAVLDPNDPIEAAIIDHFGPTTATYVLSAGMHAQHRWDLRKALQRMQAAVAQRPIRNWQLDKPLGRLLGEFDAALAAGGEATSAEIYAQIQAKGGLTASNLAHLRIKRLDRLGRSSDLLALPELTAVLLQDPPAPVREAVLNAVCQSVVAPALARGEVTAAWEGLRDLEPALPLPVHDPISRYGGQAATVLLVAAIGRNDRNLLASAFAMRELWTGEEVPNVVWDHIATLVETLSKPTAPPIETTSTTDVAASVRALTGWLDFIAAAARRDPQVHDVVTDGTWNSWPPLAQQDDDVASLLSSLKDDEWTAVWQVVGVLIDALGDDGLAPATSAALIDAALVFDRLSRGDLLSLYALTEIFLRSAPTRSQYVELLKSLKSSTGQWVGATTSDIALDFADRLVVAACPDEDARVDTAIALLGPLHRIQHRLEPDEKEFARQLCEELGTQLEWHPAEEDDEFTLAGIPRMSVLLYSLDEAVLDRVSDQLVKQAPSVKVSTSHDKVGTASLKHKARNADVIVMATRCAKHAATGFITDNAAADSHTGYADGSGSASLLRAAVKGIRDFLG
ncbi:protein DpdD [Saccharothrix variisporea]|uniref:Uncharacterized protein n=1 Tax=Saccharothrix variisporea TaxID=543527 RepID=A0A495XRM4_9PSEU|nr:protein DpdD [Saccharothrix variisporea]RKT74318.1 hypothetical protein DFJ66_7662 [Saccharothrix variisporea]